MHKRGSSPSVIAGGGARVKSSRHTPIGRARSQRTDPVTSSLGGGGGRQRRQTTSFAPSCLFILRFNLVMDRPPCIGVRALRAEHSFPFLIGITRCGCLIGHATLRDGGPVRILAETVPCRTCCAVRDTQDPRGNHCIASVQWNQKEAPLRHRRIWILLSPHF